MITLLCPAKLNLFLAIGDKDATGYHQIDTIMVRNYELSDRIYVEDAEELTLECESLPTGENNTIIKAIRVLEEVSKRKFTYKLKLEKHIPVESGLGGGSSDAAAIMIFINEDQSLEFSHDQLMELGAKVGMDVPFFISGHLVAHATHYGELIQGLPDLPKDLTFKIHSGKAQSTAAAYKAWDESGKESTADSTKVLAAIHAQNTAEIIKHLHNDFELISPLPPHEHVYGWILAGSGGAYAAVYGQSKTQQENQE